ncbi:DUF4145 domain-containing protein [Rahnella aceris]
MSWVCPHCNHAAVIRENDKSVRELDLDANDGLKRYRTIGVVCPNPKCKKASIFFEVAPMRGGLGQLWEGQPERYIRVLPLQVPENSIAKEYPAYIPAPILQDYIEACAIIALSPKSSATLARRALQGMIRDFWEIKEDNLSRAIKAIEDKVTPDIWEAIDGVRKIGNIGAHMEKDINLIIDVNPEEATLLIEMIEMLLDDWYVARHEKQQRVLKMKELAEAKFSAKKQDKDQPPA